MIGLSCWVRSLPESGLSRRSTNLFAAATAMLPSLIRLFPKEEGCGGGVGCKLGRQDGEPDCALDSDTPRDVPAGDNVDSVDRPRGGAAGNSQEDDSSHDILADVDHEEVGSSKAWLACGMMLRLPFEGI